MRGIHEVVGVDFTLSEDGIIIDETFLAEIISVHGINFLLYREDKRRYEYYNIDHIRRITGLNDSSKDLFMTKEYWEEELTKWKRIY